MTAKMIKVDERTHARLAQLAAEHGATIGGYVGKLADAQRTQAEWEAIRRQSEDYVLEHFGFDPSPQERAELMAEHAAIMAELDAQFAARRHARPVTG
jgi:adenylosuccinate lyase